MAEQTELEKRHAQAMETVGTLQRKLDEQLQLHVDKDASHAAAIEKLKAEHVVATEKLVAEHAAHVSGMKDDHEKDLARLQIALSNKHAAEIADLKAKTLIPSLKDLQARQAADLAAKHAAQLAELQ